MGQTPDPTPASPANQFSVSALNVARCRAIAAHESRAGIRGPDTLAEIFLGEAAKPALENPAIHAIMRQKMAEVSPGGYEFFIARTAYLDAVTAQALRDTIPQLVFLGAGYDTRSYRFRDLIQGTRIFELDMAATQQHKRALLEQAGVEIPAQLTFVPIDFTRDDMAETLIGAGYSPDRQTLFIWEGVTYYLPPATVDETFNFIRRESPPGSIVCFDYMIAGAGTAGRYGARESRAAMQAMYTNEPLYFDLEESQLEPFLAERGFQLVEHLTAPAMQERYLILSDGSLAGQVLDLFGLVRASLTG